MGLRDREKRSKYGRRLVVAQEWTPGSRRKIIKFRCYTQNYWMEGSVSTLSQRLVDFLNGDAAQRIVAAEDALVHISQGGQDAEIRLGKLDIGADAILVAIPIEDAPRPPDLGVRSTLAIERVILGVGPYQIMGDAYTPKNVRAKGILGATERRFVVLTDAVITHRFDPQFQDKRAAVCVNRLLMDFIGTVGPGAR